MNEDDRASSKLEYEFDTPTGFLPHDVSIAEREANGLEPTHHTDLAEHDDETSTPLRPSKASEADPYEKSPSPSDSDVSDADQHSSSPRRGSGSDDEADNASNVQVDSEDDKVCEEASVPYSLKARFWWRLLRGALNSLENLSNIFG